VGALAAEQLQARDELFTELERPGQDHPVRSVGGPLALLGEGAEHARLELRPQALDGAQPLRPGGLLERLG
jgi:hypothetical protein